MNKVNHTPQPDFKTLEDLFSVLFGSPQNTAGQSSPPPPPAEKVFEYIFAFGNEEYPSEVQITENYYTEDEFERVADEVFATSWEPVKFTKRERDRTLN